MSFFPVSFFLFLLLLDHKHLCVFFEYLKTSDLFCTIRSPFRGSGSLERHWRNRSGYGYVDYANDRDDSGGYSSFRCKNVYPIHAPYYVVRSTGRAERVIVTLRNLHPT